MGTGAEQGASAQRHRRSGTVIVSSLSLILAGPWAGVSAQEIDRGTSVAEREATNNSGPGTGILLGSFVLRPTMRVETEYNDNIYATDTDKRGDIYVVARPAAAILSDFGRHALGATAYYERSQHAKYTGEDVSQYGATVDGRYDIARTSRLSASGRYDRAAESRGSLGTFRQSDTPARYTSLEGQAAFSQDLGALSLGAGGRVRTLSYADVFLGPTRVSQRYRDFTINSGSLTASYGFHELTRIVLVSEFERRRFDLRSGKPGYNPAGLTNQSADGFRIEAGVSREITSLLTGTLRVGYLSYDYADSRLRDISGFSYFGDLNWNISRLTTVIASATRRLDETTSPVTAGNLRDEFRLGASHELLRRLILTTDLRYAAIRPSTTFANIHEFEGSVGAQYYLGRNLRVTTEVRRNQRTSADRSIAFRANSVLIGLRLSR